MRKRRNVGAFVDDFAQFPMFVFIVVQYAIKMTNKEWTVQFELKMFLFIPPTYIQITFIYFQCDYISIQRYDIKKRDG